MPRLLLALILSVSAAVCALAASPVDAYIAARDAYVKKFADVDPGNEAYDKAHDAALRDLAARLKKIIGPSEFKGFPKEPTINLESLSSGDKGFGMLDALRYSSRDEKTQIVVTTQELLDKWLRANKDEVPQDAAAALKSEAFLTRALYTDAAFFTYAELPVANPGDAAFASALLVARSQDVGPLAPDEIVVALTRGARVYLVTTPAAAKVSLNAACDNVRKQSEARAQRVLDEYQKTEPKDEKLFDRYTHIQEEADQAYRGCFASRAKSERWFPALVKQAQGLVDALPRK
jgi:hypothetical protein